MPLAARLPDFTICRPRKPHTWNERNHTYGGTISRPGSAIDYLTSSKSTIDAVKLMIASELPRIEMLEFRSKFKRPRNSPQLGESPVQFELAAQSANIVR
jgi:hypothetical protein